MDRPLERRTAARTAVVWDAVRALLERPDVPASSRSSTSAAAPAGSRSGWPPWATGSPSSTPAPTPSPRSPAGPTRRGWPTGSPASRATSATCAELAPEGGVDLVLCHGVLGLVEDPAAALATIASVLRPGGALSLLVSQRHAAVLARAMAGHFTQAKALLDGDPPATTDRPAGRAPVHRRRGHRACSTAPASPRPPPTASASSADLVPSTLLDLEPGASAALLDLERAVADAPRVPHPRQPAPRPRHPLSPDGPPVPGSHPCGSWSAAGPSDRAAPP